jgi:hypothetical protein
MSDTRKNESVVGDDAQALSLPEATPEMGNSNRGSVVDSGNQSTPEAVPEAVPEAETAQLPLDGLETAAETAAETAVTEFVGFDPSIHASNRDGTPKYRQDGSYALKRGRKSGAKDTPAESVGDSDNMADAVPNVTGQTAVPGAVNAAAASMSNQQTAVFLVETVTGILGRAIGPEWLAEKEEKKGLSNATKQYLDAKGGLQITPEMGLVLALSAYAVPRLATENTQSKLSRFVGWCSDRVAVIRRRLGV